MLTSPTLADLIVENTPLHQGQPTIAGTGVAVRTIVGYYKLGYTPEETAAEMMLDLAGVYAALAYYHLNQAKIEADIVANSEAAVKANFGDPPNVVRD